MSKRLSAKTEVLRLISELKEKLAAIAQDHITTLTEPRSDVP